MALLLDFCRYWLTSEAFFHRSDMLAGVAEAFWGAVTGAASPGLKSEAEN